MNTKPTTVVHIITCLNMGGAERSLVNLVSGMDPTRFTNIIISIRDLGYWGPILQQRGFTVVALNMHAKFGFTLGAYKLMRLLRKIKPDYVQGWMYHANVVALLVGKLAGIKKIYWNIRCSIMDLSRYSLLSRLIFKLGAVLAKYPSGIINNSIESIKQHTECGYKNKNWIHIPNGFNTQHFIPSNEIYKQFRIEQHLPGDAIVIGMVARFDPMKDHITFLKAAGILAKQQRQVYFVCAGRDINSDNAALQAVIRDAELQARVILLEQVDNVHELYPALDFLTQTSIFGEGFPNVVAEAMSCGVPCFVTDVGDSLHVIGDTGYVIAKQHPQALAHCWQHAITNKSEDVNAPRARITQEFSIANTIAKYEICYGYIG